MNKNCIKFQIIILALMFSVTVIFAYIATSSNKFSARTDNTYRVYSGGIYATSSNLATTNLSSNEIGQNNTIWYTVDKVGGTTLTLPASSTLPFAYNTGDTKTLYFRNATTTTADGSLTLSAGAGGALFTASSTSALAIVKAGKFGKLEFIRKANRDFDILFQSFEN